MQKSFVKTAKEARENLERTVAISQRESLVKTETRKKKKRRIKSQLSKLPSKKKRRSKALNVKAEEEELVRDKNDCLFRT
jgi:hypothetical protein